MFQEFSINYFLVFKFYYIGYIFVFIILREDGEIGRHATLRGWCTKVHGSSSLLLRTNKKKLFLIRK